MVSPAKRRLATMGRCHGRTHREQKQSDQMLRIAAECLSTRAVCASLDIDPVTVKHRFGFAA